MYKHVIHQKKVHEALKDLRENSRVVFFCSLQSSSPKKYKCIDIYIKCIDVCINKVS